ncbi:MAG: sister chromatid cohesion C-terminus-domain-containing protein [Benniella sp.]|nr:MAG: sister chromatid cohesion C-terminus-domain-containing protein [Benniella sp.]
MEHQLHLDELPKPDPMAARYHIPTDASSGLQYSALASLTSADSILRDLPSLGISFPEFRLAHQQCEFVSPSQHTLDFEIQYLSTVVSNANVGDICFQPASQITAAKGPFTPYSEHPLSSLAESVLNLCTNSISRKIDSGQVYQLPKIDSYETLSQLRHATAGVQKDAIAVAAPTMEQDQSRKQNVGVVVRSLKRPVQDEQDKDEDVSHRIERLSKKVKSQSAPSSQERSLCAGSLDGDSFSESASDTKSVFAQPLGPLNAQLTRENDPTAYFEDLVLQYMENRTKNALELGGRMAYLSSAELKQIGHAFEDLSKKDLLAEVQVDTLSELLKYLDIAMSEFIEAETPLLDDSDTSQDDQTMREKASCCLDSVAQGLDHVGLSIMIFNGNGLLQYLFAEELLVTSLTVFKSHLETILAPAMQFPKANSGLKNSRMHSAIVSDERLKTKLLSLVRITGEICERLCRSDRADMSDGAIVKLAYTAFSLFFIDSSDMALGPTEAESLKRSGSSLLRMVYARYPDQRTTILEEILSSLTKVPHGKKIFKGFRSIDGLSIHSFSALLMQLVQAAAEIPLPNNAPVDFQNLHRSIQRMEMQKLLEDVRAISEGVKLNTIYIFNFLLSRCTKGTKSSVEADYRSILDSFLSDLLAAVGHPEWPIAEFFLFHFGRAMVKCLDDGKPDAASKAMAVDSLGHIAAKVKATLHQLATETSTLNSTGDEPWQFFSELGADTKMDNLTHLRARYSGVVECLGSMEANDSAAKAAKNLWISQWIIAICAPATKCTPGGEWTSNNWEFLTSECLQYWKLYNDQERPHKPLTQGIGKDVSLSAIYLTARQQLFASFDMILSRILSTLEAGAVTLRAKSLKALSLIVTGDHAVLAQHNVRKTIALRLQDQSPSVRDAAAELVGKYMLQDAQIRRCYYDIVSERIADTGLNVRKRVVRLLRDLYFKVDGVSIRSDIAQRLLLRVYDEEVTVKDLATKSVADIWLGPFLQATGISKNREALEVTSVIGPVTSAQKREISRHARLLVDMVGRLSIAQDEAFGSVIQSMLRADRGSHLSTTVKDNTRSFSAIVDCLVDLSQTLQEEDAPKSEVAAALRTLHTFTKSEPHLLEAKHLSTLTVYFHCATTPEDWRITLLVLRIYQDAVLAISHVPLSDIQTAERLLLALVAKCPAPLLPEAVSVLCLIAKERMVCSGRLCKFFQTCMDLLHDDIEKLRSGGVTQENKLRRLMTIVGLVCMHFPFEQVIKENPEQAHLQEFKANMPAAVQDVVFDRLALAYEGKCSKSLKQAALQSLGFVLMSFPVLFNTPRSIRIMDSIFENHDTELKTELLQIFSSLLARTQSTPVSAHGKDNNPSLVAKPEDHLEAAIGSAVMQRYLDRILRCALVHDSGIQTAAMDVISQVTLQALAHPVLCMPAIVALESSDDRSLSDRAFKIHQDLHQKHASLIYSKTVECVRTMYKYQQGIHAEHTAIQGYRIISDTGHIVGLLNPLYSLISERRQARNALLLTLIKVLDPDLAGSEVEVDGNYCRFIAENIASLEYRTMEEIYLVIYYLNRIIAGAGMTVAENISVTLLDSTSMLNFASKRQDTQAQYNSMSDVQAKLAVAKIAKNKRGHLPGSDATDRNPIEVNNAMESTFSLSALARISVAVEAAVVLKRHLKRLYDISETKSQQFHPTVQASHKEKPVPRFTGLLARMEWRWNTQEIDSICQSKHASQGVQEDESGQGLIKRQLEYFKTLLEAETVHRGHFRKSELSDEVHEYEDD